MCESAHSVSASISGAGATLHGCTPTRCQPLSKSGRTISIKITTQGFSSQKSRLTNATGTRTNSAATIGLKKNRWNAACAAKDDERSNRLESSQYDREAIRSILFCHEVLLTLLTSGRRRMSAIGRIETISRDAVSEPRTIA